MNRPFTSAVLTLILIAAHARAQGVSVYQQLRALEAKYPRIPYDSVLVGTFDAASGSFTGEVSTNYPASKDCTPDIRGKTKCTVEKASATPPTVVARARKVGLTFRFVNAQGPITAMVNGVTATASPSATSVTVPVSGQPVPGDTAHSLWSVSWRVASGAKSYRDSLIVDRMSFGLGAFTIPVLPIAIVYDPPQDSAHDNVEVFSTSATYGSSMTMSFATQGSFAASASTQWQPFVDFYAGVKTAGTVVSAVGQAVPALAVVGQVLSAAATVLPAIFGTANANIQNTTTSVKSSTHQLSVTTTDTYKTAHLGPGKGDLIVYYKNMRVAWFSRCCVPLALTPIGADLVGSSTVAELQADLTTLRSGSHAATHSHLDSLSIQALLALDPFVAGGNGVALSAQRFDSLPPPIGLSSVPVQQSFSVSEITVQRLGTAISSERLETDDAGLLASLELASGPDSSGTISASITQTNLAEQSAQQSRSVDVVLGGRGLDTSIVNAYYDRVFGTVAVRIIPSGPDVIAGDLANDSTQATAPLPLARPVNRGTAASIVSLGGVARSPLAGRIVTLTAAGRTYRATTDERGHYVFRIPHNPTPLEATITLDRSPVTQRITLAGSRVTAPLLRVR